MTNLKKEFSEFIDGEDLDVLVGPRAGSYATKWRSMFYDEKELSDRSILTRTSWNWGGFFLGPYWLAYRKMGLLAFFSFVVFAVSDVVFFYFNIEANFSSVIPLEFWVGMAMNYVIAQFGNSWYLNWCLQKRRARADGKITVTEFRKDGGTSPWLVLLYLLCLLFWVVGFEYYKDPKIFDEQTATEESSPRDAISPDQDAAGKATPSCEDKETLDLVKKIIGQSVVENSSFLQQKHYLVLGFETMIKNKATDGQETIDEAYLNAPVTQQQVIGALDLVLPRATAYDVTIEKYACTSQLEAGEFVGELVYETQSQKSGEHIVNVQQIDENLLFAAYMAAKTKFQDDEQKRALESSIGQANGVLSNESEVAAQVESGFDAREPLEVSSPAPSFDCAKAQSNMERLICSDPALANLDRQLSAAYKEARALTGQSEIVKKWQRNWISSTKNISNAEELTETMSERVTLLSQIAASTEGESAWNGFYMRYYNDKVDTDTAELYVIGLRGGKIYVDGNAVWNGPNAENGQVNVGQLLGNADLRGATAIYSEGDDGCRANLVFSANALKVYDETGCGGLNVTFNGSYRKR